MFEQSERFPPSNEELLAEVDKVQLVDNPGGSHVAAV
jgi:hypothetical protein